MHGMLVASNPAKIVCRAKCRDGCVKAHASVTNGLMMGCMAPAACAPGSNVIPTSTKASIIQTAVRPGAANAVASEQSIFFKTAVSIFTSMPNIRCLRLCWQVRVVKPTNTIVNLRTRSLPYLRIGPFEKELDDLAWCGRAPIQLVRHAN